MAYSALHEKTLLNELSTMKSGDFMMVSNGATPSNLTASNADNAAIRLLSLTRYGHALLYLGNGNGIEMPLSMKPVKKIIASDKSNAIAFVRCKKLSNKQRAKIASVAKEYFNAKKGEIDSYSTTSSILSGMGTIASSAADAISYGVTGSNILGRLVDDFTQTPGTALAATFAAFSKYPDLNCSSLVTYLHAAAGHIIDDSWLRHPSHATPRNLWEVVQKRKSHFSYTEVSFG